MLCWKLEGPTLMIPTILSRNQQPLLLISFALTFTVHTRFPLSLSLLIHIFLSYVLFSSWTKHSSSFSQLIINPSHFCSALSYHLLFLHFFHLVCVCACFHFNPFNNNSNIKKLVQKSLCSFYVKKKEEKKKDNP